MAATKGRGKWEATLRNVRAANAKLRLLTSYIRRLERRIERLERAKR